MRQVRLATGLIAGLCALVVGAAPALASGFEASEFGAATKGKAKETQTFIFSKEKNKLFTIECKSWKSKGTATSHEAIVDAIKPGPCESTKEKAKANFATPLEVEYKSDGHVTILKPVTIKIPTAGCEVIIEAQSLPPEEFKKERPVDYGTYINYKPGNKAFEKKFPEGQKQLHITNSFKHMDFELQGKHGLCAELAGEEGEAGSYTGTLLDEISTGELWFEPEEA